MNQENPLAPIEPGTYTDDPVEFVYTGRRFRVTLEFDYDAGPPQAECEGHGVVVPEGDMPAWAHGITIGDMDDMAMLHENEECDDEELAAASLMRVLADGHGRRDTLWYDVLRTLQKAEAEGWGMDAEWMAAHPDATPAEIRMAAVEKDFEYLSGWYNDDWCYVGVVVTLLTEPDEDDETEEVDTTSCWRFESTDTEGQNEYVRGAAEELLRSNP
jgi:hypothetical protein